MAVDEGNKASAARGRALAGNRTGRKGSRTENGLFQMGTGITTVLRVGALSAVLLVDGSAAARRIRPTRRRSLTRLPQPCRTTR